MAIWASLLLQEEKGLQANLVETDSQVVSRAINDETSASVIDSVIFGIKYCLSLAVALAILLTGREM